MQFIPEIEISIKGAWIFSLIFFVLNFWFVKMFPNYLKNKFLKLPKIDKYYLITNQILYFLIILFPILFRLNKNENVLIIGMVIFFSGIIVYSASFLSFAAEESHLLVTKKLYKISRNPMYLSFFIIATGFSLIAGSLLLFILSILQLISALPIIKAEEKYCESVYGEEFKKYTKKVRRFL